MYKKYFAEYYVSDEELKELIYRTIENLTVVLPNEFSTELLQYVNPEQDSLTFLQNLVLLVPIVEKQKKTFEILTENQSLRICAISLDYYFYAKRLESLLLKMIHMGFGSQLLGVRYLIAAEIIENELGEDLIYDGDLLSQSLMDPSKRNEQEGNVIEAILAEEEIERVCNNETVSRLYWNAVDDFETSVENYIKQGLPNITYEMFGRIFYEAVLISTDLVDKSLGLESTFNSIDKNEWVNNLFKIVRRGTNYRLGIKHGGVRKREGFSWTKERTVEFYQAVESIPRIKRKKNGKTETIYIWDYIYEQFESRGIDAKELLKSEPSYASIPPELLNEAFTNWGRYEETYKNLDTEYSPKMFLFRHALLLLGFPNEYFNKRENNFFLFKKETLQKKYDAGKRLIGNSDNQDET